MPSVTSSPVAAGRAGTFSRSPNRNLLGMSARTQLCPIERLAVAKSHRNQVDLFGGDRRQAEALRNRSEVNILGAGLREKREARELEILMDGVCNRIEMSGAARACKSDGELDEFGAMACKRDPESCRPEVNVLSENGLNCRRSLGKSQGFLVSHRGAQVGMKQARTGGNQ